MTSNPRSTAALVLATAAFAVALGGTAHAADGGSFLLGKLNSATKSSALSNTSADATLKLTNTGTGPAASFTSATTAPPFTVSNGRRIERLNADRVDNLHASQFERSDTTPVLARVGAATTVAAEAARNVTLSADLESYDPSGMHADAGSADLVAPKAGTYVASALVSWDATDAGYRRLSIVSSGAGVVSSVAGPALPRPAYTTQNTTGLVHLEAGQSVHVEVLQGSGGPLGVQLDSLQLAYVSP